MGTPPPAAHFQKGVCLNSPFSAMSAQNSSRPAHTGTAAAPTASMCDCSRRPHTSPPSASLSIESSRLVPERCSPHTWVWRVAPGAAAHTLAHRQSTHRIGDENSQSRGMRRAWRCAAGIAGLLGAAVVLTCHVSTGPAPPSPAPGALSATLQRMRTRQLEARLEVGRRHCISSPPLGAHALVAAVRAGGGGCRGGGGGRRRGGACFESGDAARAGIGGGGGARGAAE